MRLNPVKETLGENSPRREERENQNMYSIHASRHTALKKKSPKESNLSKKRKKVKGLRQGSDRGNLRGIWIEELVEILIVILGIQI